MSNEEVLGRAIRVTGLPDDYEVQEVIETVKQAGEITEHKRGANEMIVIFGDASQKDMVKMYDGAEVAGKYKIQIEDADNLEVKAPNDQQNEGFEQIPEARSEFVPSYKPDADKKEEKKEGEAPLTGFPVRFMAMGGVKESKDFLDKLNNVNLRHRVELSEDDPFIPFMKRDFFLSFIAIWSVLWFLGSLFL